MLKSMKSPVFTKCISVTGTKPTVSPISCKKLPNREEKEEFGSKWNTKMRIRVGQTIAYFE
jgi:hypothetical protein